MHLSSFLYTLKVSNILLKSALQPQRLLGVVKAHELSPSQQDVSIIQ